LPPSIAMDSLRPNGSIFVLAKLDGGRGVWAVVVRLHLHVEVRNWARAEKVVDLHRIGARMFAQLTFGGDSTTAIRCSVESKGLSSRRPLRLCRLAWHDRVAVVEARPGHRIVLAEVSGG